jgi:HlyD family type I secretion membrane fusion protein
LEFQLTAAQSQEKNYAAEIASTQELLKKGLAHRPRLMELKRAHDEFTGRIGNITSAIAGARQEITQLNIKLIAIKNDFHHKVSDEIKDNHRIILELDEKYTAAKDTLERTEIKAPVDGIVSELKHFTIGGVIPPGQNIMDIVPADDKLIIEAQVPTQDIDSIYPGMLAKVQFSAFKARTVPRVEGKVIYIAPDRHVDERGGAPYYLVRIEVDDKEFDKLTANVKLYPGMPATVFIIKGTRTMLQYLLSPLMDSFYRSFKET